MLRYIHLLFAYTIYFSSFSQDLHWSQPTAIPVYQNPAFSALAGKYSLGISHRDQWHAIDKSYRTYALSGDYRFEPRPQKAALAVGSLIYRDAAAGGAYLSYAGGVSVAAHLPVNLRSRVALGLSGQINQFRVDADNYTWGSQFDGQGYNPALGTGEEKGGFKKTFGDLGAGVAYIHHKVVGILGDNNPGFFMAGYSIVHLNRPPIAVVGGNERLAPRHTLMISTVGDISGNLGLKSTFLVYRQGKMTEVTGGLVLRFGVGQLSRYTGIRKHSYFSTGMLYRLNDALIPSMEFEKPEWSIILSYDINVSRLSPASRYLGGLELTLRLKSPGVTAEKKTKPVGEQKNK